MRFTVVGTNHAFSPVDLRERIAFSRKQRGTARVRLQAKGISSVVLSTCNRAEIYARISDTDDPVRSIGSFIADFHGVDERTLTPCLYAYTGRDAARHLFKVASGIDSQIIGETQILGQVRSAFRESVSAGCAGTVIDRTFSAAISAARKVHAETGITEGKISVGSVAVEFIRNRIGKLNGKTILVLGVGKVTELVLHYLKTESPRVIFISNRTFEKARELAGRIDAGVFKFNELAEYLPGADVVITATASPGYIITPKLIKQPRRRPLLLVDLAVPRDVDPGVGRMDMVDLFSLDDLDGIIAATIRSRRIESMRAETIIEKEVDRIYPQQIETGGGVMPVPGLAAAT